MDYWNILSRLQGKRILGINPPVRDFAFFDLWAKPVGLLSLLFQLRNQGNAVELVDAVHEARTKPISYGRWKTGREEIAKPAPYRGTTRRYFHFGLTEDALTKRLQGVEPPDLILLTSMMTYWYPGVFWCVRVLRRVFPEIPILLGGVYARLCPEHAAASGADMIQSAPLPVQEDPEAFTLYERPGYVAVRSSSGCPYRCSYCASRVLDGSYRHYPVEELVAGVRRVIDRFGCADLAFLDDALLVGKEEHFYPLCDALRAGHSNLRLHTPNGLHLREIDSTCADVLYGTGFRTIRLSLEGTDAWTMSQSSAKMEKAHYCRAVDALRRAGYRNRDLETYILVGMPGQSVRAIEDSIAFAKDCGGRVKLAQYSPIPGTSFFREIAKQVPAIREEPLLQNNTVFATQVGKIFSAETLQRLKDIAHA
ncbi:MAG: radical SAM protein [Synergistales bacterium]|nr:radical SAM protein [Synergistales bacterium]